MVSSDLNGINFSTSQGKNSTRKRLMSTGETVA